MDEKNDLKERLAELLRKVKELDPNEPVPQEILDELDKLVLQGDYYGEKTAKRYFSVNAVRVKTKL